jgi:preprotein translocase subunit SecF
LIYSIAASVAIIIAFGTGFLITGRQGNNSIDQSSIAVIDSSLINEQAEQEQVQPLADDKEAKELNEVNENKDNATDQTKENQNKQEHKTKAKSIKATSNGTLLPPMFGDERIIPASDSIKNDSASQLADTVNLK